MKRLVLCFSLLVMGCADGFTNKADLSLGRDFSMPLPDMGSVDLSVDDSASPPVDLTVPADLTAPPADLTVPPDLTPLMCDLGGFGDGGPTSGRVFVAAIGPNKTLHTARFAPGMGWSSWTNAGGAMLADVSIASAGAPDKPLVVARHSDDTLSSARFEPCLDNFAPLSVLHNGASTSRRAALTGGLTADVIFKGSVSNDQRLYHSHYDGALWSLSVAQNNFLTTLAPSVVRDNGTVHAVFTGTDTKIYDGTVASTAGGGTAAEIMGCTSDKGPSAVLAGDGSTMVVFTGMDTNLYWVRRPSGGAFTSPAKVCPTGTCLADTNDAPVLTRDANGAPLVAFVGKNKHVYTASFGSAWTSPIEATQASELTDHLPAIAPGVGMLAELVYVRNSDGLLRHVRLNAGLWGVVSTLSGAALQAAPALISLP
jgi:hypothetical protein